jgi:hypothetical protein
MADQTGAAAPVMTCSEPMALEEEVINAMLTDPSFPPLTHEGAAIGALGLFGLVFLFFIAATWGGRRLLRRAWAWVLDAWRGRPLGAAAAGPPSVPDSAPADGEVPSDGGSIPAADTGRGAGERRHFTDNPVAFAAEVARATREGGVVYIDASKASGEDVQAFLDALEVATSGDDSPPNVYVNGD